MGEFNDNNDNAGNGVLGKFQERIKKIRFAILAKFRNKFKKNFNKSDVAFDEGYSKSVNSNDFDYDKYIQEVVKNVRKKAPYRNVRIVKRGISTSLGKDTMKLDSISIGNISQERNNNDNSFPSVIINMNDKEKKQSFRESLLHSEDNFVNINSSIRKKGINLFSDDNKRKMELDKIGEELLEKIKENFLDKLSDLEILESDLFLLSGELEQSVVIKKVKEIKEKIYKYISALNSIIDQYNNYSKSYYMDRIIDIDDSIIVSNLEDFRMLLDSIEDEKLFINEIKRLDEFKLLYDNLKDVSDEVLKLENENEKKINDFNERDKKYEEIVSGVGFLSEINKKCQEEIDKQDAYFDKLLHRLSDIKSVEYTTYHLMGLGKFIGSGFDYIFLRLFGVFRKSHLSGTVPGVAVETLVAGRMVSNIFHSLHWEERKHIRYEVIDYDNELLGRLSDVRYVDSLIDDMLNDINSFKEDFLLQYDSRIPGYNDTLKKINKMYDIILQNKRKIIKLEKRLNKGREINQKKLAIVRKKKDSN